ncbi:hypothetical protein JHK84_040127 [Glycine max]|nr:hypothetical protein JHK84_040127 [Glycine max]
MERCHEEKLSKLKADHDQLEAHGATLTWYGGLPPWFFDSFNTLVECFSVQYETSWSHRMTSATLASLRQADNESLQKFMKKFGCIVVQIHNLNPEVALHSMLLALQLGKFADNLCKKKTLVAWTSCTNEPKATSRWKECQNHEQSQTNQTEV